MAKTKAILPDSDKQSKEFRDNISQQAKDAFEKQYNQWLRKADVKCPVHGQQARITLKPFDASKQPKALDYRVQSPCCQELVDRVRAEIGSKITVTYK